MHVNSVKMRAWFNSLLECIIGAKWTKSGLKSGTENMFCILSLLLSIENITKMSKLNVGDIFSPFYSNFNTQGLS